MTSDRDDRFHPFRRFVAALTGLLETEQAEPVVMSQGRRLLADLVRSDDWLLPDFAVSKPERYQQYLLYLDPSSRFSIVSFVWAPGQTTPVHNHTVWGLVGLLRGSEVSQGYEIRDGVPVPRGQPEILLPGDVTAVSPSLGDIHKVSNAFDDRDSISIHVYGADIGKVRRSTFTADGRASKFISGYANTRAPSLSEW